MRRPLKTSNVQFNKWLLFLLILFIFPNFSTEGTIRKLSPWICWGFRDGFNVPPPCICSSLSISDKEMDSILLIMSRYLYFDSLIFLTAHQAASLGEFKGYVLDMAAIREIGDSQLESLSKTEVGSLGLNSLTSLSTRQASLLANSSAGAVYLDGLRKISDSIALILSRGKFNVLSLAGLDTITGSQAENLSYFHWDNRYARAYDSLLDLYKNTDSISRLWEVLILIQRAGFHDGGIILDGLTHISDSAAVALSHYRGNHLQLWNLKSLTNFQAWALAEFIGGDLCFGNLDETSKALFDKYRTQYRARLGFKAKSE